MNIHSLLLEKLVAFQRSVNRLPENSRRLLGVVVVYLVLFVLLAGIYAAHEAVLGYRAQYLTEQKESQLEQKRQENEQRLAQREAERLEKCKQLHSTVRRFQFEDEIVISDQNERDRIHYLLEDKEYLKTNFGIVNEILEMKFLSNSNDIIYLTGSDIWEDRDQMREVVRLDLDTRTSTTLYSLQTKFLSDVYDIPDAAELRSIAVSPDESRLLIITDTELILYDLNQNAQIFSDSPKFFELNTTADKGQLRALNLDRHYYQEAVIAPTNNYAILQQGYWETSGSYLYNFQTKDIRSLDIVGGNGGGEYVVAWLGDDVVYEQGTVGSNSIFCRDTMNRSNATCFPAPFEFNMYVRPIIKEEGESILLAYRSGDEEESRCLDDGSRVNATPYYISLVAYNFVDSTERELLHTDYYYANEKIIAFTEYEYDGRGYIFLQLELDGQKAHAILDPQVPEKLIRVKFESGGDEEV